MEVDLMVAPLDLRLTARRGLAPRLLASTRSSLRLGGY